MDIFCLARVKYKIYINFLWLLLKVDKISRNLLTLIYLWEKKNDKQNPFGGADFRPFKYACLSSNQ